MRDLHFRDRTQHVMGGTIQPSPLALHCERLPPYHKNRKMPKSCRKSQPLRRQKWIQAIRQEEWVNCGILTLSMSKNYFNVIHFLSFYIKPSLKIIAFIYLSGEVDETHAFGVRDPGLNPL